MNHIEKAGVIICAHSSVQKPQAHSTHTPQSHAIDLGHGQPRFRGLQARQRGAFRCVNPSWRLQPSRIASPLRATWALSFLLPAARRRRHSLLAPNACAPTPLPPLQAFIVLVQGKLEPGQVASVLVPAFKKLVSSIGFVLLCAAAAQQSTKPPLSLLFYHHLSLTTHNNKKPRPSTW